MPSVSNLIQQLKASPTLALNTKAKAMKASGKDIINFGVGEPDFGTPDSIIQEAIAALQAGKTKYGPAGGSLPLRTAITNKLKNENQMSFEPDEVVVGMGAKEILFHTFLSLLNPGDEVIVPNPFWVSYKDQITAAHGKPVMVGMASDGQPALDELKNKITTKTKAIVFSSPSNPSGVTFNEATLHSLIDIAEQKDLWIISDEIYERMVFDEKHISVLNLKPKVKERCVLINGLSKGYAMTGWRVGYAAGPKSVITLIKKLQSHSSTCIPPFIEAGAIKALDAGPALMADHMKALDERRKLAVQLVSDIPSAGFIEPKGAFYLFVDISKVTKDSLAFSNYLLENYHVAAVPGEAFGTPGFLRVSYAVATQTLKSGIQKLKEALESYES